MIRRCLLALILFVLVAPILAADQPEPRVYRDVVRPHWSDDGDRFWYRNDLAGGAVEFVLVDAVQEMSIWRLPPVATRPVGGSGATVSWY